MGVKLRHADIALYDRSAEAKAQLATQTSVDGCLHAVRPADNLVRSAAGDLLGAERKGTVGRTVCQIDRDDHGDAYGNADDQEDRLQGTAPALTPGQSQQWVPPKSAPHRCAVAVFPPRLGLCAASAFCSSLWAGLRWETSCPRSRK